MASLSAAARRCWVSRRLSDTAAWGHTQALRSAVESSWNCRLSSPPTRPPGSGDATIAGWGSAGTVAAGSRDAVADSTSVCCMDGPLTTASLLDGMVAS
jgi:hypothetical protein